MRHFCLTASRISGVQGVFRMWSRGPTVLFYHGVEENIVDPEIQRVQMPLRIFEKQIAFLRRHREVISMDDLHEGIVNGYRLDPRQVVLTFDDGYKNNRRIVAPFLHMWNLPFTVFVSTRHVSEHLRFPLYCIRVAILYTAKDQVHLKSLQRSFDLTTRGMRMSAVTSLVETARSLPLDLVEELTAECMEHLPPEKWADLNARFISDEPMDWNDVRAVRSMGATIGSHCHDHCILHAKQSKEEVFRQLNESKAAIQKNVGECRYLAYPNGTPNDISRVAYSAAKSAQFRLAFTTIHGEMTPDVDYLLAPRLFAYPEYEEFCYLLNRSYKQNESYRTARPPYADLGRLPNSESESS